MLYVVTGANGTGKTLNTLKWVRELQLKESRPVAYNGRFDMVADFGWKKIDAKDWQDEPDGTIFLFDECHNDFPVRGNSAAVPAHVQALGEHRRRGFDFFLISQHPQNIDLFIRRLVGSPGWHRHLKRASGAPLVSVLEWNAINAACEKPSSGKSGSVKMVPFPKEVYEWYNSASLHTAKVRIPSAVWILLACVLLVPALGYFAFRQLPGGKTPAAAPAPGVPGPVGAPVAPQQGGARPVLTKAEYISQRIPRLDGFPQTAPVYDAVTQPTEAPFPAACVASKTKCNCYTQQATLLQVADDLCRQIVERGFFVDWQKKDGSDGARLVQPNGAVQQPAQQAQPMPASWTLPAAPAPAYRPAEALHAAASAQAASAPVAAAAAVAPSSPFTRDYGPVSSMTPLPGVGSR